jgi:hypothetical protein
MIPGGARRCGGKLGVSSLSREIRCQFIFSADKQQLNELKLFLSVRTIDRRWDTS